MNRRDFFRQAAALSRTPGLVAALLASVERAAAIDPPAGSSFADAEHIVILMQENRSFDHVFGALRGVRGFDDPRAVTLPDGDPVWLQKNAAGERCAPFRLGLNDTRSTWLGSLPHSWADQSDARNHGNHDGWLDAKKSHREDCAHLPLTMGYYDRRDLPLYYALADAFTVCDQNFCSSLTGTTANRLYFWTGTIREKQDVSAAPNVLNSDVDFTRTAAWKTFPERLEEAGVSWRVYQNELSVPSGLEGEADAWLANFTDNPLEWFDQYRVQLHRKHREYLDRMAAALPVQLEKLRAAGDARKLRDAERLHAYVTAERARWTPEALDAIGQHDRTLHGKAFTTNADDPDYRDTATLTLPDGEMAIPKGDPLHRFRKDVAEGALPRVSWLVPSERLSDHPSSPWYGAWYVAEVINALTKNPDLWRKTVFILTYDENDGWFDHVPPFVAPAPGNADTGRTSPELDAGLEYLPLEQDLSRRTPLGPRAAKDARGGPIGLGYRVPLIVASPWSRGGYVCSQVFDHTSVLQFLEGAAGRWSGRQVREQNISPWRRAVCGDLSSVFRSFTPDHPQLDFPSRDSFFGQIRQAQNLGLPEAGRADKARQEPGARPSVALPYDLHVNGRLSADRKAFGLEFVSGKAAAPFHVYTPGLYRNKAELRTRAYAVGSGRRLSDSWDLNGFADAAYHLCVCGPNGFFREFAGTAGDREIDVVCAYEDSGGLRIEVRNESTELATLRVRDESYAYGDKTISAAAGSTSGLTIDLAPSHLWYDFTVQLAGANNWLRRYSGRIENGRHGFSDPRIGRA